ncbi:MAG TPA: hypothetical protein VHR66_04450 [Gemmataceae bacterium]|jgi:hypothetical protein|nr:hypothetical protein [Gemmataceae bacterium]
MEVDSATFTMGMVYDLPSPTALRINSLPTVRTFTDMTDLGNELSGWMFGARREVRLCPSTRQLAARYPGTDVAERAKGRIAEFKK